MPYTYTYTLYDLYRAVMGYNHFAAAVLGASAEGVEFRLDRAKAAMLDIKFIARLLDVEVDFFMENAFHEEQGCTTRYMAYPKACLNDSKAGCFTQEDLAKADKAVKRWREVGPLDSLPEECAYHAALAERLLEMISNALGEEVAE